MTQQVCMLGIPLQSKGLGLPLGLFRLAQSTIGVIANTVNKDKQIQPAVLTLVGSHNIAKRLSDKTRIWACNVK